VFSCVSVREYCLSAIAYIIYVFSVCASLLWEKHPRASPLARSASLSAKIGVGMRLADFRTSPVTDPSLFLKEQTVFVTASNVCLSNDVFQSARGVLVAFFFKAQMKRRARSRADLVSGVRV
jgi:hypothetical protein